MIYCSYIRFNRLIEGVYSNRKNITQVHIRGGKIGETPLHIAARIEEGPGEKCTKMLLKVMMRLNLNIFGL